MYKFTTLTLASALCLTMTSVLAQNVSLQLVSLQQPQPVQQGVDLQAQIKSAIEEETNLVQEVNKLNPSLGFNAPPAYDPTKAYTQDELNRSKNVIGMLKAFKEHLQPTQPEVVKETVLNKEVILFTDKDQSKDERYRKIPHWKKNEQVLLKEAKGLGKLPSDMDTRNVSDADLKQMMVTGRIDRNINRFFEKATPENIAKVREQITPEHIQEIQKTMDLLNQMFQQTPKK